MNQLFKITLRWLKKDKKRTLLTFSSIMLAVYLITFVGTFCSSAFSVYDSVDKYQNGVWHAEITAASPEQAEKAVKHAAVERSLILTQNYSFISDYLESNYDDSYTVSYEINDIPAEKLSNFNITAEMLSDGIEFTEMLAREKINGRMPEKAGEIALNRVTAYRLGKIGIGDTVSIGYTVEKDGNICEQFEYKAAVTGIIASSNTSNIDLHFNSCDEKIKPFFKGDSSYTSVYLRIKKNCDAVKSVKEAGLNAGIEKMTEKDEFYMNGLRLVMEGRNFEYIENIMGIILIFIIVIAIFTFLARLIINNAFELSIAYRTEQYGALKTVGASDRQIFAMVMFESVIYSVIAVPAGAFLAFISGQAVIKKIESYKIYDALYGEGVTDQFFSFEMNPYIMAAVVFVALFSIFFSSYADALRVMRMPPIKSAMYGSGKSGRKRKRLWISRRIFGCEFGFAVKTIARHKIRFAITILAAVMSGILFITVSWLSDIFDKLSAEPMTPSYDLSIYFHDARDKERELAGEYDMLENSGYFSDIAMLSHISYDLDSESISEEFKSSFTEERNFIVVKSITSDAFRKLDTDVTYKELVESGGILLCGTNKMKMNNETGEFEDCADEPADIIIGSGKTELNFKEKNGGEYTLQSIGKYKTNDPEYIGDISIMAVIPIENFEKLKTSSPDYFEHDNIYYIFTMNLSGDAEKASDFIYENYLGEERFDLIDNTYETRTAEAAVKTIKTAGNALAAVLLAVAALNIISTMSGGMINRRKELSVMRSCGMSMKQIFASVTIEGFFYSVISASVSGAASLGIIQLLFGSDAELEFPFAMTFALFAAVELLILISAAIPLAVMAASPIAENIRNE